MGTEANKEKLALLKKRRDELRAEREKQQDRAYETLMQLQDVLDWIDDLEYEMIKERAK